MMEILLENNPNAAGHLPALIEQIAAARPAVQHSETHATGVGNVVNSGPVGGNINNAGRDVNSPTAVLGAGAVGGAAGVAGAAAGVKAGSASGTTAAVGGGTIGPKAVVVTLVVASATATGGGYAAYAHYTCSPLFGDRPAAQVLNTATHKFTDASFKFNFRAGGVFQMAGEFDNRQRVGQFHATSGADSIDYIQDHTTIYYRSSGGTWTRKTITSTEDARIAQGNPIKTAEYLSSTGNATQNHCAFRGAIDGTAIGLDSSTSSLPFEASTNPDGYLTHLKITLPQEPGDLDWQVYDYGTKITITPPQTE